ncbi:MAG: MFS transporter [Methanomethylovorans sp.]|uniref:MFS transporter n=1 Tax=Methanomethylovorans sp. TaxID=2758717 RepID=UPI003531787B
MAESKISIYPLLAVNFIGTLGLSLVLPFLIFLVERFGGNAIIYGLTASMYPIFQLFGGPLLGRWSDMYGRKKILLISQVGTFISWIIFLVAMLIPVTKIIDVKSEILGTFVLTVPLIFIFIARAFDGITGGNVSVANAYLADITSDADRSSVYGKLSVSTNLGFIFGPALAGILSVTIYGEILPVIAAVLISLVGILMIIFLLPESPEHTIHMAPHIRGSKAESGILKENIYSVSNKMGFLEIMKMQGIFRILSIYFLIFLAYNVFYTAFPVHAANNLKWNAASLGLYFSILSLLLVFVEGPLLSWVSKRYSDYLLLTSGSFMLIANFVLLVYSTDFLTYVSLVFFALGNGFMWPSLMSILSKTTKKEYQGAVQGVSTSFTSLASIVGLVAGGFMFSFFGTATFVIAASILFGVFLLSLKLDSSKKEDP